MPSAFSKVSGGGGGGGGSGPTRTCVRSEEEAEDNEKMLEMAQKRSGQADEQDHRSECDVMLQGRAVNHNYPIQPISRGCQEE